MNKLDDILAAKRAGLARLKRDLPWSRLEQDPLFAEKRRPLADGLRRAEGEIRFLCEIKRASPSAGEIQPGADAVAIARAYADSGAGGISLVTEEDFFRGRPDDLPAVRTVGLPVLMKDFFVDPHQIGRARALGADAVLLIMALRDRPLLEEMRAAARDLTLQVICEVHSEEEVETALLLDPEMIGVNNRDLRTFVVDLGVSERLYPRLPGAFVRLAESGVRTRADVLRLQEQGFDALLVGEGLLREEDPGKALLLRGKGGA